MVAFDRQRSTVDSLLERFALPIGGAVAALLALPVCALLFDCGCVWAWAGAAAHCNIHRGGPHCPWCSGGIAGFALVLMLIIGTQGAALWLVRRRVGRRLLPSLSAVAIGGVVGALAAGYGAALVGHYPRFLGFAL